MSITKTVDFENLLNYWSSGNNPPSSSTAINTLFQLTEDLKLENCTYQEDVIDAMFRQVYSDETKPFDSIAKIPGRIYAPDFDKGVLGAAYYDNGFSDYHVTTGTYTAWNEGWSYRNDGADISECNDVYFFHNGYQVGWFEEGEFLQYEVDVDSSGVYDINFRYSANNSNSKIYFSVDDTLFTPSTPLSNTNNWSFWNTATIPNAILYAGTHKIRLHCEEGEINVNSFEFVRNGDISSVDAAFIAAKTTDDYNVELLLSKPIDFNSIPAGLINNPNQAFTIHIDSTNSITISGIQYDPNIPRIINLQLNSAIQGWSTITGSATKVAVSYSGNQINANDGSALAAFSYRPVINELSCTYNCIPGKIEAENYFFESGISVEGCSDIDGGYNIGYLNTGDYVDYYINAKYSGSFQVSYRNASNGHNGTLEMQLIDTLGNATTLNQANFNSTGGWQTWQTTNTSEVFWLDKGVHHIRVLITLQEYNLNWFQFDVVASDGTINLSKNTVNVYPNPTSNFITVRSLYEDKIRELMVFDLYGKLVKKTNENILDLKTLKSGIYFLKVFTANRVEEIKIIKN